MIPLSPGGLNAQTITGYVLDNETSLPLDGALVILFSETETFYYQIQSDGYFMFDVYPGVYQLGCTMKGYDPQRIEKLEISHDEFKNFTFSMLPEGYAAPQTVIETSEQPASPPVNEIPVSTEQTEAYRKTRFLDNPRAAIGAGYAFGEIGGLEGCIDVSLEGLFKKSRFIHGLFFTISGGGQTKAYKSDMFNEPQTSYDFSFTRFSAGFNKVIPAGRLLITPAISGGMEQAKPISDNVHAMIDGDRMRVFFFNPSLSLGYAITNSLAVQLTGTYYLMMDDVRNNNNKIFAYKRPGEDTMTPWSYTDDFFDNRKGFSLVAGLKFYF